MINFTLQILVPTPNSGWSETPPHPTPPSVQPHSDPGQIICAKTIDRWRRGGRRRHSQPSAKFLPFQVHFQGVKKLATVVFGFGSSVCEMLDPPLEFSRNTQKLSFLCSLNLKTKWDAIINHSNIFSKHDTKCKFLWKLFNLRKNIQFWLVR